MKMIRKSIKMRMGMESMQLIIRIKCNRLEKTGATPIWRGTQVLSETLPQLTLVIVTAVAVIQIMTR